MFDHVFHLEGRRYRSPRAVPRLEVLEDRRQPASITYASYLGGNVSDEAKCVATDPEGDIYVAGRAGSDSFPGIAGERPPQANGFVAKFDPTGANLLWAAYIDCDTTGVTAIAVDSAGNAYVTGSTDLSSGFATTGAAQTNYGGNGDAFVVKLTAAGSIAYATYVGGNELDDGLGVAVDAAGDAFVTGYTTSANFPVQNPLTGQSALHANSGQDAFVTEISPDGSRFLFSTYLGGNQDGPGDDGATSSIANSITVDPAGNVYLSGETAAADFPMSTNTFQKTIGSGIDVFVTEINPTSPQVVYSTFLGGTGPGNDLNIGYGIAVDSSGNILVAGSTDGVNFPIKKAFDSQVNHGDGGGNDDAFITKLDPKNTGAAQLIYSTYLGGSAEDYAQAIAVDAEGDAYVTGNTGSQLNFPLAHAFDKNPDDAGAFVAEFGPTGTALLSSYYGDGGEDGEGIAVSPLGSVVFVGHAESAHMATTKNAFQPVFPGESDSGFVAMLGGTPTTMFKGVDSDGDQYTVKLTGPGAISVIAGPGPIQAIYVAGTDSKSVLTIDVTMNKSGGNGLVDVGSITGSGLSSISAPDIDLDGAGIDLMGALGSVSVHDVDAGAEIVAADTATQSTSITAHAIGNGVTINPGGAISTLKAASIGTAVIDAVRLTTLTVDGDKSEGVSGNLAATITLTGAGTAIKTATIDGTVSGADIEVEAGSVGTFLADAFTGSTLFLGENGTLTAGQDLKSFKITGASDAFANSNVEAATVGTVSLASVETDNGGKTFGITADVSIGSVTVKSPSFIYNPKESTPQGIGDFQVELN